MKQQEGKKISVIFSSSTIRNPFKNFRWWNLNDTQKSTYMKKPDILSFVFVRHPFDRLVSAYYDKIAGHRSKFGYFKDVVDGIRKNCK